MNFFCFINFNHSLESHQLLIIDYLYKYIILFKHNLVIFNRTNYEFFFFLSSLIDYKLKILFKTDKSFETRRTRHTCFIFECYMFRRKVPTG